MDFIKGTPMLRRQHTTSGKAQFTSTENIAYIRPGAIFTSTENIAYIRPGAIVSAVYDPSEDMTAIRMTDGGNAILKGDVMREYEERTKGRQQGDGRED